MTELPKDFRDLFPKLSAEPETGPIYYLWVYDPHNDEVILEHNEDRHAAQHVDHRDLAERVPHPERVHGYAYRIKGGWRITTYEHRPVEDPHVLEAVKDKLAKRPRKTASGGQIQTRGIE